MNMREKIASSICDAQLWKGAWVKANEVERNAFYHQADAVLDALSDPTPEMEKALCAVMSDGGLYFHHPDDGDLDDYERHCFKTIRGAFIAAIRKAGER